VKNKDLARFFVQRMPILGPVHRFIEIQVVLSTNNERINGVACSMQFCGHPSRQLAPPECKGVKALTTSPSPTSLAQDLSLG